MKKLTQVQYEKLRYLEDMRASALQAINRDISRAQYINWGAVAHARQRVEDNIQSAQREVIYGV